jgi:hypothetical protein
VCVPYGNLVETCQSYVREADWRDGRAHVGRETIRWCFDEATLLKGALEAMERGERFEEASKRTGEVSVASFFEKHQMRPVTIPEAGETFEQAVERGIASLPPITALGPPERPLEAIVKPTLCLIVIGADTAAFERMDFLEVARAEVDELVLIKTKDGRFGGQGAIFNRVADRTQCDVVGIVHADTTFGPGALSTFARTASEGKVCGLVGRALDGRYVWSREIGSEQAVSTLDGCSFFSQRLWTEGPYRRTFTFDEETFPSFHLGTEDMCLQASAAGLPVVVPSASAYHHSSTTGTYLNPEWQAAYWATREKLVAKWAGREFQTT